jgi:hypothetical protein
MSPSYSQDASIEYQDQTFYLSAGECRAVEDDVNRWFGAGDPSTWLTVAVFELARRKVGAAPQSIALGLTARALGLSIDNVISRIEWHEQYMRWHDGDQDYSVLSSA